MKTENIEALIENNLSATEKFVSPTYFKKQPKFSLISSYRSYQ